MTSAQRSKIWEYVLIPEKFVYLQSQGNWGLLSACCSGCFCSSVWEKWYNRAMTVYIDVFISMNEQGFVHFVCLIVFLLNVTVSALVVC